MIDVWVHTVITGGELTSERNGEPVRGICTDGSNYLDIAFTTRATEDPASSVLPIAWTGCLAIRLENELTEIRDLRYFSIVGGVAHFKYKCNTPQLTGMYQVFEKDLNVLDIGGNYYRFKLANQVCFEVYNTVEVIV